MTTTSIKRIAFADSVLLQRIGRYLEEHAARQERARQIRETRRELSRLSDRELADLGMHRAGIPRIAREAVDANPR
ncbi:MAG: DUF1127 domain-containing protein [Pseudomonadota bacterium]